ncbi:MAG TPA: glycoside hydrolase family 3 C-terminal domain-containing protein, partial [Flavitalea sp.]|nr:glycoside hydrolase family 3 C-terminal domain-containing protein [Flavitalea sp.]
VLVINSGSAVDVSVVEPYADAVLLAWYPGQEGGNALADILFGKISPSGKLPVTFYRSLNDLPSYTNYSMKGRTYRYFKGEVQYPFGFGLSYTHFDYAWMEKPVIIKDSLKFSIRVKNSGKFDGDEVVQAYVHYPTGDDLPVQELKTFRRMPLKMNQETTFKFSIPLSDLRKWDAARHAWRFYPGEYKIVLGSNSMDARLSAPIKIGK